MIGRMLDKLIGVLAPATGARRIAARASMAQIEAFTGSTSGYEAGRLSRLTKYFGHGRLTENAVPSGQLDRLRALAWDLYRNNPHARKIVRSLESKVVGNGMHPTSQAKRGDGTEHAEFRQRASQLWRAICCELDYRGRPGKGGVSLPGLAKQLLRSTILSGEALYQLRPISIREQLQRRLTLPVELQLIHADRLASDITTGLATTNAADRVYRGIELDTRGRRVAYWLYAALNDVGAGIGNVEAKRYPADDIGHVFIADDIDQLRGVPWFAPALLQMKDTSDYQYNELKASELASCIALGVRRPTGASGLGLNLPTSDDTTDSDSNTLTAMQPGMIVNLGQDGGLEGFNPSRPTTNAEAWINHMLRSTACGLPGTKSSTVTGDFRNSSFSSERSADNDNWPEVEGIQCWLAESFYQPIYEEIITAGVLAGYFADVPEFSDEEFTSRRYEYLSANWQGPVARSINPVDDAKASAAEIAAGLSSPQIECAKRGRDWQEVFRETMHAFNFALEVGLPEELALQFVGVAPAVIQQEVANEMAAEQAAGTAAGGAEDE